MAQRHQHRTPVTSNIADQRPPQRSTADCGSRRNCCACACVKGGNRDGDGHNRSNVRPVVVGRGATVPSVSDDRNSVGDPSLDSSPSATVVGDGTVPTCNLPPGRVMASGSHGDNREEDVDIVGNDEGASCGGGYVFIARPVDIESASPSTSPSESMIVWVDNDSESSGILKRSWSPRSMLRGMRGGMEVDLSPCYPQQLDEADL